MKAAVWKWAGRAWRVGLVAGFALALWAFVIEPRRLVEPAHELALPGWPGACDGLRVDALADLHVGSPHNGTARLDEIVQRVLASDADAVFLGGDYLIQDVLFGKFVPAQAIADRLRPLTARKPVFAVLGNHDWWDDGPRMQAALESAGVVVLENQSRRVVLRGCEVWIAGIGDYWEGKPDPGRAFAGIPAGAPVLALTHNPDVFPVMPSRAALVVAGHTHGGQVNLPLLGRLVVPSQYEDRYAIGHIVEGGRHLFVTPGIGTSILPVRFGVTPEISRLTLGGRDEE